MSNKIVIIGGVAAGSKAAAKIKRMRPDYNVELYTDESYISYSACGMPYFIEGTIKELNDLLVRTPEKFKEQGVDVFLRHKCIKIMPDVKNVVIKDLETDKEHILGYSKLILATGASPYMPPIENSHYDNVHVLRRLPDGLKIKNRVQESKSVTIIGGSFIALELLEAFIHNGLYVNIITDAPYLMNHYDYDMAKQIQEYILSIHGDKINLITGDTALKFEGENNHASRIITHGGKTVESDFIVVCTGVVPNSELAFEAGLELGVKNSIRVDERMQTSDEHIYAAGDCCEKTCIISKSKTYMALGSIANKEGRVVAINVVGEEENFPGILISTVTRYFDYTMSMVGLTEVEAAKLGFETITTTVTKRDKAGYMPDVGNIILKIVVDKNTQKILGAQAIGEGDVDKRITTMAGVIMENATIDQFMHVDLPYAPPYSAVVDILHVASLKIHDKLKKLEKID